MDPTISAPTAQTHPHSHSSTPTSAGACPQKPSICNCSTPPNKAYLEPIIGCANSKCRPRYYHLRCVGLFHRPRNEFAWLCPSCQPDEPLPPRICNCEDPPYRTGPIVQCTQQERCATRWFHLPCTGIWPGEDCTRWTCAECVVGIVMQQDREEEMERRRMNGEVVEDGDDEVVVQQENEKDLGLPRLNGEVVKDQGDEVVVQQDSEKELGRPRSVDEVLEVGDGNDELVEREYVSDGVPGASLGGDDELLQASSVSGHQTGATGAEHVELTEQAPVDIATPQEEVPPSSRTASPDVQPAASPLKRKSDEADSPPRKKAKRASPVPTPSPEPEEEPEYCVCGTPADNDMIACDAPNCHAEWFHFVCVGLTGETIPEGKWYCDECAEVMEKKKKKKTKGGKGKGKRKR